MTLLRSDTEALGHPGTHSLDEDVRDRGEAQDGLHAGRVLEVGFDGRPAPVQRRCGGGVEACTAGAVDTDHVRAHLGEQQTGIRARPPELQVDSIWVLNRGSLTWADPGTLRINPAPEKGDAIQAISSNPGQVLLQMTAHLHAFLQSAFTPGLRILDYFGDASFGNHLMAWVPDEEGGQATEKG